MRNTFIKAIHDRKKILVHFFSPDDREILVTKCAPIDCWSVNGGESSRISYDLWDYEAPGNQGAMTLPEELIVNIEILDEPFDPAEFADWPRRWVVARDWRQAPSANGSAARPG